jgi:hypothetical protein
MLSFKRKTPTEKEQEKLEGIEYRRRLQEQTEEYKRASAGDVALHGGREYVEPTWENPCPLHPDFKVPYRPWLASQPAPRFVECPECRDERVTGRRRDLERAREAAETANSAVAPVVVQLDRGESAWAAHKAAHPELFLSPEDEAAALDRVDLLREDAVRKDRETPAQRLKRHRRHWAKHSRP